MSVPLVFAPPFAPSESTATTRTPAVLLAQYGDGYEQRLANGINPRRLAASVVWNALTAADALIISNIFEGLGGVSPFTYALPPDATVRRWLCESWTQTAIDRYGATITAEWREVFDI